MMRLDTVSQILDAVSFLLVTPEFLGKDTLRRFRSVCERVLVVFSALFREEYLNKILAINFFARLPRWAKLALSILVWCLLSAIPIWIGYLIITQHLGLLLDIVGYGVMLLSVFGLFMLAITSFAVSLLILDRIAVRQSLFLVGACTFFIARALMIWFVSPG